MDFSVYSSFLHQKKKQKKKKQQQQPKTDPSDITEILLKVALNTTNQINPPTYCLYYRKEESNSIAFYQQDF